MKANVSYIKLIQKLVLSLDKTAEQSELSQFILSSSFNEDLFLLRSLTSTIDLSTEEITHNNRVKFLTNNFDKFSNKLFFPSLLSHAVEELCDKNKVACSSQALLQLTKLLKLNKLQEITLNLALLQSTRFQSAALDILKLKVPDFARSYSDTSAIYQDQETNFSETPVKALYSILSLVKEGKIIVPPELEKALFDSLGNDFPNKNCVLSPALYNPEPVTLDVLLSANRSTMAESNLASKIENLGPSSCNTVEEVVMILYEFGLNKVNEEQIAEVISKMVTNQQVNPANDVQLQTIGSGRPQASLEQGLDAGKATNCNWNPALFVTGVKEVGREINWVQVVTHLDNPHFFVGDSASLKNLMAAVKAMGITRETFPFTFLLGKWENVRGQLSWLDEMVRVRDGSVLSVADYNLVNTADSKLFDEGVIAKPEIRTWKCLDFVVFLLGTSTSSPPKIMEIVKNMFNLAVKNCPDVLFYTLLHVDSGLNSQLKDVLVQNLALMFIDNPNASAILQWAYNFKAPQFQPLIMSYLGEYFMCDELDTNRIQRILEVLQSLGHKAIQSAANSKPVAFGVEVAMHGANRDYFNLEKFLTDHLKTDGEMFASELLTFVLKRLPLYAPGREISKIHTHKVKHILNSVRVLHDHSALLSQESRENLAKAIQAAKPLQQMMQQRANPAKGVAPVGVAMGGGVVAGGSPIYGSSASAPGVLSAGQKLNPSGDASLPGLHGQLQSLTMGGSFGPSKPGSTQMQNAFFNTPSGAVASGDFAASAAFNTGASPGMRTHTPMQGATSPTSSGPGEGPLQKKFAPDIEQETNNYFVQIYNQKNMQTAHQIEHVLELLKKFKASNVTREKEIFQCMIRNLLEEYQFFPQYPEKELRTTAHLFGGIIQECLIEGEPLGIALKYVLEALKNMENAHMFAFGITALEKFKTKLFLYRQYCNHLASLPAFETFSFSLKECITYGRDGQPAPNVTAMQVANSQKSALPAVAVSGSSVAAGASVQMPATSTQSQQQQQQQQTQLPTFQASSANIDILVANADSVEMEEPGKEVQEKVAFIFNNLSHNNLPSKADELKTIVVTDKYYPWLSRYLVVNRVTMETNFQALYASFLDSLSIKVLDKMVLNETIRNIKVFLSSDKVVTHSVSDRALLKNLGKWLGAITLAKDKPILQRSLDIRSLLFEAFHRGVNEINIVVPFVAKVMESAGKSSVFKPPNPWTMAIMSILCEIHQDPSLKLNLRFEVEMLGRSLNVDIAEVQQLRPYPLSKMETFTRIGSIVQQLAPLPHRQRNLASAEFPAVPPPDVQMIDQINRAQLNALHQHQQQQQQQQQHSAVAAVQSGPGANLTGVVAGAVQPSAQQVQQSSQQQQRQPLFAYHEINAISIAAGLTPKIRDSYPSSLFHQHAALRNLIKPSIERTVQELLNPLIERSVKIAVTTCEQMIKKDFALDPEEIRMRKSAINITQHLTATMTLITCKEPLLVACTNNLRNAFTAQLRSSSNVSPEMLQQAAQNIASDNLELCVAFTQKSAIEKALVEIEKKLTTEFDLRRHARNENRRYCDSKVLTYQAERMPEQLRMKVGTVTPKQLVVYEEFGREIPGFATRTVQASLEDARSSQLGTLGANFSLSSSNDDLGYMYNKMCNELEQHLKACNQQHSNSLLFHAMKNLLEAVLAARNSREIMAAVTLLNKTVDSLLHGLLKCQGESQEIVMRFRDCHLLVLKGLQDPRAYGAMWTNKNVTKALIESREPNKYCVDGIDCLIKTRLVNMQQFDLYLTTAMENGFNYSVVSFAMKLVFKYLFDETTTNALLEAKYADLYSTIEMLIRIGKNSRSPPEELSRLIEMIGTSVDNSVIDRQPGGPIGMMHSGISQAREFDDPPGLKEKTDILLREWVTMYHSQGSGKDSTKAFSTFVTQMHTQGILKTDDLITRFFRICTEVCVDVCYRALNDSTVSANHSLTRARCYHTLDAFVRLIALLVRHSGDAANTLTKINLLNKVLGLLTGVLLQDHETKNTSFQQLPYHRIFIMLFMELCAPDEVLDGISFQVLTAFSYALHVLRPSKAPGFAYAWLELISNRIFIARMLHLTPQQKAWAMYAQLLIDQFRFLAPFLRNAELSKPVQLLYKGTLRVLLVLLHDFPEFLCEHHYVFADVIPPNCIQMRNLILSAFPRHMRLPDPFTADLKVDLLPDIKFSPRILHNFAAGIPSALRKDLDLYLKSRSPVTFLSALRSHLQVSNEPGVRYNVLLMNALVLYVGVSAINAIQSVNKMPSMSTIPHSPHMDVYQNLAVDLDTEGRYLFLNAIANHLRYPNNHTHYFSCVLLYLFAEANSEHIQEQITRVLLERVIVNRPHPWGLLITFIELINNPNFKFWNHEFVKCAPEIEKLFDSVAKSCMQRKESGGVAAITGASAAGGAGSVSGSAVVPSSTGSGHPSNTMGASRGDQVVSPSAPVSDS